MIPVRPRPCEQCPWVKSTPSGQFSAERYEILRATTGRPGAEAPVGAPMFACHRSREGKDVPCAGWLAAVGYENLTVRVNVNLGALPAEVLTPGADWPELFDTYAEMEAAQARAQP